MTLMQKKLKMGNQKMQLLEAVDQVRSPVWDDLAEYVAVTNVRDGEQAYRLLKEQEFQIVLVDLHLFKIDGLELLRRIKQEKLCPTVVLTSQFPSFSYAQQGIIYGAADYLLRPLEREKIVELLARLKNPANERTSVPEEQLQAVLREIGTEQFSEQLAKVLEHLGQSAANGVQTELSIRNFYQSVITQTFEKFPWLARFQNAKDYERIDWLRDEEQSIGSFCARRLDALNRVVMELYPAAGDDKCSRILVYILEHIDGGCLQRDVAAQHFLSSSALSELFQRRLKRSYHSYVSNTKILRAEYLLKHSDLKIYEISTLLGYKDANYFSRIFRQKHHMSLSEFRKDSSADYQI